MAEEQDDANEVAYLLRRVWIRGFRSLEDVGPLILQPGLTVLTGVNDGGKSATLDAIGLLLTRRGTDARDVSHWSEGTRLEVEGEFEPMGGGDPVRVRVVRSDGGGLESAILELLHPTLAARPQDLTLQQLREAIDTLGIESPGGTAKAPYFAAVQDWLHHQPLEDLEPTWRAVGAQELSFLPGYTRFDSVEAPSPVSHVQGVVSAEARRLLQTESFAADLSSIASRLDSDVAASVETIRSKILAYCSDLDDVEIEPSFDFTRPSLSVDVRVNRAGTAVDLDRSGQGRRRRIALAIHEANLEVLEQEAPSSGECLVYDEPDTHLDYASQRSLFEILERQAKLDHVQVVVATHSLNFVDKVPLQSIAHFSLTPDLRTAIEVLSSEDHRDEQAFLASVCAGLGLRNSVLLDERCFLVVEGETEEAAFPLLFRAVTGRSLTSAGVTLINTKGSGAIRRLVEVLATKWGRDVVVLADEDARESVADWLDRMGIGEADGTLHFVGTKEFEDAFADEVWLRALSRFSPCDSEEPWSVEQIASMREADEPKFSEALNNLVRRRCRDSSIGKPDLGLALSAVAEPGDVPAVVRACIERALVIASA